MAKFSINHIEGNNNVVGDKNIIINHSIQTLPKIHETMLSEDIETTCKILSLLPDRSKTSTKALINLKLPNLSVSSEEVRVAVEILVENGLALHEKPRGKFDEIWLTSKGRQVKSLPKGFRDFFGAKASNQNTQIVHAIQNIDKPMNVKNDRIFLCHASEDKPAVAELYFKLKANNLNPWLDKEDLLPGQNWKLEIPKALKKSRFIIIFFSSFSVIKRGYVQREFKLALDTLLEIPEGQIFIIPVRLDECEIPDSFLDLHHVDLFEYSGFEKVLKAIASQIGHDEKPPDRTVSATDSTNIELGAIYDGPYYAAPGQLAHQKGKWAVFRDGAQMQGTLTNTEEDAKASANNMNKNS